MKYRVLYEDPSKTLIERLLKIRKIEDNARDFINPTFSKYRINPYLLKDLEKAIDRILFAIKKKEKIMIFADYDVDGITSSYMLYTFFTKFLNYKDISIKFPHRLNDGYGMKKHHLDEMKEANIDLIITVDNGITSVQEAIYAKKLWIELIITDHHHQWEIIPEAFAVINPQISPDYTFKWICWVWVAFKFLYALMEKTIQDRETKIFIFNYFLPIVAIGTVADCVPLINENRLFVKTGLELINKRKNLPKSLEGFLDFLNIKDDINTFHIGFLIAPRINAWGRVLTPYESLYTLLYTGEKQLWYLENLEELNTQRKKLQDQAYKIAESKANLNDYIIIVYDELFHEGVIGIVAGRLTEKYHKPSVVFSINKEKNHAVASLRGPEYFNVIEMLHEITPLLERSWGHKQAGGLCVSLDNLAKLIEVITQYGEKHIDANYLEKTLIIDTPLYNHELNTSTLLDIKHFEPYGQGNEEPLFIISDCNITEIQKVWQRGNGHLKIKVEKESHNFSTLFRSQGNRVEQFSKWQKISIIGTPKKDDYNGWFFIEGKEIIS